MSLFKKVLFPVTLSLDLEQILDNALFLKRLNIQSFDLINVVSSGFGNKDDSLEALHQAVGIIRQKIPYNVSAEVVEGHAASEIVNMARGQDYNLIFIPGHDKNIMNRSLLGSTTSDVIRMTNIPTLIYKNYSDKPANWGTVIYATDFEEAAERAVPYVEFIGQAATRLIIQHVGKRAADPNSEKKRKEFIKGVLEERKRNLELYWAQVITVTELGSPSAEILSAAEMYDADLIVLGRGNPTFLKAFLGSTAEKVANSVKSSVLLIP